MERIKIRKVPGSYNKQTKKLRAQRYILLERKGNFVLYECRKNITPSFILGEVFLSEKQTYGFTYCEVIPEVKKRTFFSYEKAINEMDKLFLKSLRPQFGGLLQ